MTDIEILKKLTGEQDETLLRVVLADARDEVLAYTNRSRMIPALEKAVRDLAVINYNRLGTEGEVSRNEAGESYSFNDTPQSVYGILNRYRLARVGGGTIETEEQKD